MLNSVHEKSALLEEAEKAATFIRNCEEASQWLEQTEPKIASQELAKDAQATQHLLNQHKALAEDFDNQNSKIKELEAKAAELEKSNNFKAKDLKNQVEEIREKYDSLAPVLENRGQVLKKSLADYELLHDINEHRLGLNNFEILFEYFILSKSKKINSYQFNQT